MYRTVLIGLMAVSTASAYVETVQPYISVSGGLGLIDDARFSASGAGTIDVSFDEGSAFEVAAGVQMDRGAESPPLLRGELAYAYQANDVEDSSDKVEASVFLFNGYLDYPTRYFVTPYVLAGVGVAYMDFDIDDDTVLAGQVGAGIGFDITDNLILDLKYAYFLTEKVELQDTVKAKANISGHRLQLGVRVSF